MFFSDLPREVVTQHKGHMTQPRLGITLHDGAFTQPCKSMHIGRMNMFHPLSMLEYVILLNQEGIFLFSFIRAQIIIGTISRAR